MKNIFTATAASLLFMASAAAQGNTGLTVGYCSGDLPTSSDIAYQESNSYVQAAIYIPAGTVRTYAGNALAAVRAGLASKLNMDQLTVWVRSELDGANLAEETISTSKDIVKGWNDIRFSTPYIVEENIQTGLYVGYTYHQKGPVYGIAVNNTPCEGGYFIQMGSGEWEDRSAEGTLFIEGVVEGDRLPALNLAIRQAEVPEVIIMADETVEVKGKVKNFGMETVTGFDVSLLVNGTRCGTSHVDCELPSNMEIDFLTKIKHSISSAASDSNEVTVLIDNINGGEDINASDNEFSFSRPVVERSYPRITLVEEFTTEKCVNCPRVGGYIHESLKMTEFADGVAVVCHHSGFETDWLTTDFDEDYLWFFDQKNPAAPAVMTDRKPEVVGTTVYNPSSQLEMQRIWRARMAEPAFVSLEMSGSIDPDDSGKVTISVKGERAYAGFCENPVITVYLVENGIKARRQAGAENYTHNHVNRAVNAVWGVPVPFEGNDYNYECSFDLSDEWVRENLQFVAAISNYNPDAPSDCAVMNASIIDFKNFDPSGIDVIAADNDTKAEYYTINGIKVNGNSLTPGIYVKRIGNKTEKAIVR